MAGNSEWTARLREAYFRKSGKRNQVRFPETGMGIQGDLERATIHLTSQAVTQNMQTNAAAFEGWALALIRWCGVEVVNISWDEPDDYPTRGTGNLSTRILHYNRFLFRLERYSTLFDERIVVAHPKRFKNTEYNTEKLLCLNCGTGLDTTDVVSEGAEAKLEKMFVESGIPKFEIDIGRLDRQFPVGVFRNQVAKHTAIFTGGKSAIDLLGVDRKGHLWIFELKAERNIQLGALSELFFYSMLLGDVFQQNTRFAPIQASSRASLMPKDLEGITRINACLLAPDVHPLIDASFLDLLNVATKKHQREISYYAATLKEAKKAATVTAEVDC